MILPKLWLGRIQKYWDFPIPLNFPKSSSEFSLKFESEDIATAVETLKEQISTGEDNPVKEVTPENTIINSSLGIFDVKGEPNERTLLSPNKIQGKYDGVIAMHFNSEANQWEQVSDTEVDKDGYVWGTLQSFSPVAVFTYRKDIFVGNIGKGLSAIVCNGNPVKVFTDPEDQKVYVQNTVTGTKISTDLSPYILGGSNDASPIDSTSILVTGVNKKITVYAGSYYEAKNQPEGSPKFTTIKSAKVRVVDSDINCVTGSMGCVRTDEVTIDIDHSKMSFCGVAETYIGNYDVNGDNPTLASPSWVKKSTINIINDSYVELPYQGGNTGYSYTVDATTNLVDSKVHYLIAGGSNGRTDHGVLNVSGKSEVEIMQSVNRGTVGTCEYNVSGDAVINKLFIGGDATDKTVTGITNNLSATINKNVTATIYAGFNEGITMTAANVDAIVKYVKVSRDAKVEYDNTLADAKKILADKIVIK
jgi:hypothetical protein